MWEPEIDEQRYPCPEPESESASRSSRCYPSIGIRSFGTEVYANEQLVCVCKSERLAFAVANSIECSFGGTPETDEMIMAHEFWVEFFEGK